MRAVTVCALVIAASAAFAGAPAQVEHPDGKGGWGAHSRYQMFYRVAAMETVSGTVVSVNHVVPLEGMSYGVALKLKTRDETVTVHLGPGFFIEKLGRKFKKKDRLEITGSRVRIDGQPVLIAAEVRKGDTEIMLRDRNGIPAWAGRKR